MKKFLSVLLAIIMVFGLSTVAFASNGRITGAVKSVGTNASYDLYNTKPGDKLEYPLTADMFSWSSGAGATNTPVTRAEIGRANVRPIVTGTDTKYVKSISIRYGTSAAAGNKETAIVVLEFIQPLVSTTSSSFDVSIFLQIGTRQPDSRLRLQGTIQNPEITVDGGDNYVSLAGGRVLSPTASVRNMEIYLGNGISLVTNVFGNQKYYGYSDNTVTSDDDAVLRRYPAITDILRLSTVRLKKSGSYVDLSSYSDAYVYSREGKYLGRSNRYVPYSEIYYLADKSLGDNINTGNTGSGGGTTPDPTPKPPAGSADTGTGSKPGSSTSVSGTIDKAEAVKLTNSAVTKAKGAGSKTAVVGVRNKAAIDADAIKAIYSTANNAGMASQFQADTLANRAVIGRIIMNPASSGKVTSAIKLGAHIDNAQARKTKASFGRFYKNKVAVLSLDQDGSFGMPVNIAARVNLSDFNKSNIYFYSYNRATNKFYLIRNPNAWIDGTGYVRFTTTMAGDIVISEGPLVRK